jgi:hypothetical protein
MLRNDFTVLYRSPKAPHRRVLMETAGALRKPTTHSLNTSWLVHALEWTSLLPVLGVCAWVILNYG